MKINQLPPPLNSQQSLVEFINSCDKKMRQSLLKFLP